MKCYISCLLLCLFALESSIICHVYIALNYILNTLHPRWNEDTAIKNCICSKNYEGSNDSRVKAYYMVQVFYFMSETLEILLYSNDVFLSS